MPHPHRALHSSMSGVEGLTRLSEEIAETTGAVKDCRVFAIAVFAIS